MNCVLLSRRAPPVVLYVAKSGGKAPGTLSVWGQVPGAFFFWDRFAGMRLRAACWPIWHFPVRHSTIHFHCGSRFSTNAASPSSAASVVRAVAATAAPALSSVLKCSPIVSLSIRFVS